MTLVLPFNGGVRTAVEAGTGVAVLSSLVVAPAIKARMLHAAPIEFGPRAFFGLHHKERYRTKAADALLELIGLQHAEHQLGDHQASLIGTSAERSRQSAVLNSAANYLAVGVASSLAHCEIRDDGSF